MPSFDRISHTLRLPEKKQLPVVSGPSLKRRGWLSGSFRCRVVVTLVATVALVLLAIVLLLPAILGSKRNAFEEPGGRGRLRSVSQSKKDYVLRTSHQSQSPTPSKEAFVWWLGIVKDAKTVQDTTWDLIGELSCQHDVHVHILVQDGVEHAHDQYKRRRDQQESSSASESYGRCADFQVQKDKELSLESAARDSVVKGATLPDNRIDRIAQIRDLQRQALFQKLTGTLGYSNDTLESTVVIVADMDMFRFPPAPRLLDAIQSFNPHDRPNLSSTSESTKAIRRLDGVCAAGVTLGHKPKDELWYYDTYATVFWPNTYAHPLHRRKVGDRYFPGEDPRLVRSDDAQHGNFTQGDIMKYLQTEAHKSTSLQHKVRVRSCFGGLALYRASVWLLPDCQYSITSKEQAEKLQRYASKKDDRTCEHIVLHDCIHEKLHNRIHLTIDPEILTLWKRG